MKLTVMKLNSLKLVIFFTKWIKTSGYSGTDSVKEILFFFRGSKLIGPCLQLKKFIMKLTSLTRSFTRVKNRHGFEIHK